MKTYKALSVLLICSILLACSTVNISTDYVTGSDFSSLKTYKWHPGNASVKTDDARMKSELMQNRIRTTIDKQLTLKGFNKQENNPDFLVSYGLTTENKIEYHSYHSYGGYGPSWSWGVGYGHGYRDYLRGPSYTETVTRQYKNSTLSIDVIDQRNHQLVWRGIGSKALPSTTTPEELDELVALVVESILKEFPPER